MRIGLEADIDRLQKELDLMYSEHERMRSAIWAKEDELKKVYAILKEMEDRKC